MKRKLLTLIFFLTTILTFAQTEMFVNTEQLNIRSGAGSKYEVIGKLSKNEKITVISTEGKWTEIKLDNGTKGFVSSKFLIDTNAIPTKQKSSNWPIILIIGGIILFSFFKKSNKNGSSNSRSSERSKPIIETKRQISTLKPKVNLLRWYHCKNCNIKIEAGKQPTSMNCSGETFHRWTDLGEVGNQAFSCKNCGTTVYTTKQPTSMNCARATFHKWTKLS